MAVDINQTNRVFLEDEQQADTPSLAQETQSMRQSDAGTQEACPSAANHQEAAADVQDPAEHDGFAADMQLKAQQISQTEQEVCHSTEERSANHLQPAELLQSSEEDTAIQNQENAHSPACHHVHREENGDTPNLESDRSRLPSVEQGSLPSEHGKACRV